MTTINIKQAKQYLRKILESDEHLPVLLWGQPGIGKSQCIQQVANELGWEFIDIRLPLLMPSDLLGLPYPSKDHTRANFLYPAFFPDPNSKKKYIILFDEIGNAPMTLQSAAYRIILDRSIGEHYKFPKGVRMIAASNREKDKSGVGKFSQALSNRFVHFFINAEYDSWKEWAIRNNINEKIIGFLKDFPQHLCVEPKIEEKAYATPRSWEYVSKLMNIKVGSEEMIAGAVGEGVQNEFFSYMEVYGRLPDIDKILKGEKEKVPTEPSILFALSISLVMKATKKNVPNIFKYCKGMKKEFEVKTIKDLANRSDDIFEAYPQHREWLNKHNEFFNDD